MNGSNLINLQELLRKLPFLKEWHRGTVLYRKQLSAVSRLDKGSCCYAIIPDLVKNHRIITACCYEDEEEFVYRLHKVNSELGDPGTWLDAEGYV